MSQPGVCAGGLVGTWVDQGGVDRLEKLLTDPRNDLRERVLWRMLLETAARAEEVLTLAIGDLDTEFRRAVTRSKGGDT
jgi:integrase